MRQCPKAQLLQCPIGPTSAIVDQTNKPVMFLQAHNFKTLTPLITRLLLQPDFSQKKMLLRIINSS